MESLKQISNFDKLIETMVAKDSARRPYDYAFERLRKAVRGKDVSIVGGADEWRHYDDGTDKQFWVRINNHYLRQGGKCDALFHTVCDTQPILEWRSAYAPEFIFLSCADHAYERGRTQRPMYAEYLDHLDTVLSRPIIGWFAPGWYEKQNPYGPQYEWLHDLQRSVGGRLFTGLIALAYLVRTEAESIHLTGMDLFEDQIGHLRNSVNVRLQDIIVESHLLGANVSFLRSAAKDQRVTFGPALRRSLESWERRNG